MQSLAQGLWQLHFYLHFYSLQSICRSGRKPNCQSLRLANRPLELVRCGHETRGQRGRDAKQLWPAPKLPAWKQHCGQRAALSEPEHKVTCVPILLEVPGFPLRETKALG